MSSWTITTGKKMSKSISPTQRLAKDLKEVLQNPLPGISALPLDNNLFVWHVNIQFSHDGKMKGSVLHLILSFPTNYPSSPPEVQLCTPLPHANVESVPGTDQFTLCLDLLTPPSPDTTKQYAGWSSAYSVQSLLLQLQAFIVDESLLYRSVEICSCKQAASYAKSFRCEECGHCNERPFPSFKHSDNTCNAEVAIIRRPVLHRVKFVENGRRKKKEPEENSFAAKAEAKYKLMSQMGINAATKFFQKELSTFRDKVSKSGQPKLHQLQAYLCAFVGRMEGLAISPQVKAYLSLQFDENLNFILETKELRPIRGMSCGEFHRFNFSRGFGYIANASKRDIFVHITGLSKKLQQDLQERGESALGCVVRYYLHTDQRRGKVRADNVQIWPLQRQFCELLKKLTHLDEAIDDISNIVVHDQVVLDRLRQLEELSTLKNRLAQMQVQSYSKQTRKRLRKRIIKLQQELEEQSKTMGPPLYPKTTTTVAKQQQQRRNEGEAHAHVDTHVGVAQGQKALIGAFSFQGPDITVRIISYLAPNSRGLSAFACANRYMYHMTEHGALWRCYFSRRYPTPQFQVATMHDWKHAFQMESNQSRSEMVCFHSKVDFEDAVLGLPVDFTVNPKTRKIDYIKPIVEPLSLAAFKSGVRRSVWNEKFRAWLPLYITHDHFQRALPHLQTALLHLSPRHKRFEPALVLEVLPRIMNTMVVMLADKGVAVSDAAVHGYCQIHRLLIALMDHYPELQREVNARFRNFMRSEENRKKNHCPSLGNFLPLLAVCTCTSWRKFAMVYLKESFCRSVLWTFKKFPDLEKRMDQPSTGPDLELLGKIFEARKVSLRLTMFHAQFLALVACPKRLCGDTMSVADVAESYDRLLGVPSLRTRENVRHRTKEILAVSSWPDYFRMLHLKAPSDSYLTDWMKRSVVESLRAGYHTRGMNFGAVHKSGVSRLLLSGESYSAPVGLRNIILTQFWRYPSGTIFLDASMLAYDFEDNFVEHIDYQRVWSCNGSMRHSGDEIDDDKHEGKHTILVDLKKMGRNVRSMFVVLSAWTTPLKAIIRPEVQLRDVKTGMDLCRFELRNFSAKAKDSQTAVIMCKVSRKSLGSNWDVHAIGKLCAGRASNYQPIKTCIKHYLRKHTEPKMEPAGEVKTTRNKISQPHPDTNNTVIPQPNTTISAVNTQASNPNPDTEGNDSEKPHYKFSDCEKSKPLSETNNTITEGNDSERLHSKFSDCRSVCSVVAFVVSGVSFGMGLGFVASGFQ